MKIRNKFVSNSSSTCYILDLRTEGVKDLIDSIRSEPVQKDESWGSWWQQSAERYRPNLTISKPSGVDRQTAIAVGEELAHYVEEFGADLAKYGSVGQDHPFLNWMQKWVNKLGDNVVFVRASDEGMGGRIPDERKVRELSVAEMEYD